MRISAIFGADKSAYTALLPFFAEVKKLRGETEVLTARQWGSQDEDEIHEIAEDKIRIKQREYEILSDPEVWLHLETANKNKNALKKWEKKNLEDMTSAHAIATSAPNIESVATSLKLFAAGEQGFAKTHDDNPDDRAALWEDQKPLLKAGFIGLWQDLKQAADKMDKSVYEVAMMRYMPYKSDKDIYAYLDSVEEEYPAIVQAMLQDNEREEALPIPTFVQLCEGQDRAVMEGKYAAFMEEIQQSFLNVAGWTKQELEKQGVQVKRTIIGYGGYCWGSPQNMTVAIGLEDEPCIINTAVKTSAHETGHLLAMLELNRMPEEQRTQLVGQINGMGLHETYALYFEEMAKSKKGSEIIAALAHKHFGVEGPEWSAENIYKHSNPPLNSEEAIITLLDNSSDMVAMPAAYAWRVKIEQDILNSSSAEEIENKVNMMPETWASYMEKITGLKGCYSATDFAVDESHWFIGMAGDFPAYPESAKNVAALRTHYMADQKVLFNSNNASNMEELVGPSFERIRADLMAKGSTAKPDVLLREAVGHVPTMKSYLRDLSPEAREQDRAAAMPVHYPSMGG